MESKPTIKIIGPNMSIFMLIGALLVTLKLCHVIDCSWWLVLMPIYLPLGLFLVFALIVAGTVTLWLRSMENSEALDGRSSNRHRKEKFHEKSKIRFQETRS
jgi:membrane protein implicated in regulation of membrane protease activity